MLVAQGYFDTTGTPCLKISLRGAFAQGVELDAIIDTGFTGFLQVPMLDAFPVGLPLVGTTPITYANGTTENKLTAMGTIAVGGKEASGLVILEYGQCDVLLGMGFLRVFKARLVMTKDDVALLEEDWIEQAAKLGQQQATAAPAPAAADATPAEGQVQAEEGTATGPALVPAASSESQPQ